MINIPEKTIITTTETYEDRPFWQVLLMISITIITIFATVALCWWGISKLFPSDFTDTRYVTIGNNNYEMYSSISNRECFMNGVKINCSNITEVKEWWNR